MTKDRDSILRTISAFYENISGPENHVRDGGALRSLFCIGAAIVPHPGKTTRGNPQQALNGDQYVARLKGSLDNCRFFEREAECKMDIGHDIAMVSSRFESTADPQFQTIENSGVNLLLLVREGESWKIASMVYEEDKASS